MSSYGGIKQEGCQSQDLQEGAKEKKTFSSPKKFNLELLPPVKLTRVDSNDGRIYITPEGNSYPSVTTVLGRNSDDGSLLEWRKAVGEEEADRISKRATTRGNSLHGNIEKYLKGGEVTFSPFEIRDKTMFSSIVPHLNRIDNIRLIEGPLYSDVLRVAGTVDCVADYDNIPTVLDWKSSTQLKDKYSIENYFLQASIYSYMLENLYHVSIPNIMILISVEFAPPQVFHENRKHWRDKIKTLLKGI